MYKNYNKETAHTHTTCAHICVYTYVRIYEYMCVCIYLYVHVNRNVHTPISFKTCKFLNLSNVRCFGRKFRCRRKRWKRTPVIEGEGSKSKVKRFVSSF